MAGGCYGYRYDTCYDSAFAKHVISNSTCELYHDLYYYLGLLVITITNFNICLQLLPCLVNNCCKCSSMQI